MSGVKGILQRAQDRIQKLGGAVSDEVVIALREYRSKLHMYYLVLFVLLIIVVLFAGFGLFTFMKQPDKLALFTAAMGITVGGAVELLRRIWKEWSYAGLLLILVEDASEAQVASLMDKLIEKL